MSADDMIIELARENAVLVEALTNVVNKWDAVLPFIEQAEANAWVHGWRYGGPPNGLKPEIDAARVLVGAYQNPSFSPQEVKE